MPGVHKVSIALTSEQINALKKVVDTGEYATTSEVVREAVRDWQCKRELRKEDIRHLRQMWEQGKASGKLEQINFPKLTTEARQRLRKVAKGRPVGR